MKRTILYFSLIFSLALFMSSCTSVIQEIAKGLGEKNCTEKSKTPAGPNKRVLLFAKNHIYVVGQDGKYYPNMTTKNPYSNVPWKNSELVKFRSKQIKDYFQKMNKILEDNGANVYVFHRGYDIQIVTQSEIQADMDFMGAKGKTGKLVSGLTNKEPGDIHLLWLWTSTSAVIAVGSPTNRYIVIGDGPKLGNKLGEMKFAHEFGHVLGYDTHVYNDPTNLMNDGPIGTKLNQQQLQTIWTSLNSPNNKLKNLSCDK